VTVPILDDGLFEGDETFTLQLTNPTGDPVPTITTAAGTATIVDDEAPPPTTPATEAPEPAAPRAQAVTAPPTYAG